MAVPNLGTGGATLNATNYGATRLPHDGTNYVYLPGVNGNYLSTPDAAALDITGDIDLRVKVALDDWTPAAEGYLLSKWSSGQQSYILAVTTGGNLRLYWTTNGSTNILRTSTVALGLANGAVKWVRATLDVDNGASGHDAKFWTSDDGSSWTQLGTTVTTAGTTSIWSGSAPAEVGTVSGGSSSAGGAGKYYRAQVYSGIGGTLVLDIDTSVITSGSATSLQSVDSSPKTVTVNRATSGKKAVAVTASCWLLGTDDYIEVPDDANLDFAASDSFTVVAVHRVWDTIGSGDAFVAKKPDLTASTQGWALTAGGGGGVVASVTQSGGSTYTGWNVAYVDQCQFSVDRTFDQVRVYCGGTASATTLTIQRRSDSATLATGTMPAVSTPGYYTVTLSTSLTVTAGDAIRVLWGDASAVSWMQAGTFTFTNVDGSPNWFSWYYGLAGNLSPVSLEFMTSGASREVGQIQAGDGTNGATAVSGSRTSGAVSVVAAVRDVTADTLTTYLNGVAGTPVTDPTTGTLANSEVVRVGRLSGAGTEYADAEVVAVAVWRRALTDAEIATVTAHYQARWP